MNAYLQHGKAGEPMRTESVEMIERPMPHHVRGMSYTATGYGARIPTTRMVRYDGKWRRVYCRIYSNAGTCFIGRSLRDGIIVRDGDA